MEFNQTFKHISVMPAEVTAGLIPNTQDTGKIYVDGTLGGGGHSKRLLNALPPDARLIGIDRDENAITAATQHIGAGETRFTPVRGNFHHMPEILENLNIHKVDGILLDLGVSSHQLDTAQRGFSYRFDGPLDMRMDNTAKLTAADIVNHYTERDLADLIFTYGEERHSRRIASAICKARAIAPITTTAALASIIEKANPNKKYGAPHPCMRSFMAIRIAVNDELSPLEGVITNMVHCLNPKGRIAIITFHSLEDRIVKTTYQKIASPCTCPRDLPICACGKVPGIKIITRKPQLPTPQELEQNSRAHSAKLRIAEKL